MAQLDPWPTLDDAIRPACELCCDMGALLWCNDGGIYETIPCPDCGQGNEKQEIIDDE